MFTYFTNEEKGKTALLFLHGWGCDGSIFAPIVKQLDGFNTYSIDLWGFGKSQNPPENGFSVDDYAVELHKFCIEQNLTKFHIVAHSFGARVALVFCAKYPQFCQKLVITGGAGLRRKSLVRWLKIRWFKFKKLLVKAKILPKKAVESSGSEDFRAITSVALKNTFIKTINQDLSHFAKQITANTLLVWGKNDKSTPLWMAKKLNRLINDSYLLKIEGDHFAFLQNSAQFCGIIKAFLEA